MSYHLQGYSLTELFEHVPTKKKYFCVTYYNAVITRISTYCDCHKSLTNLTLLLYVTRHAYDTDELRDL